jgi:hypothetical protein
MKKRQIDMRTEYRVADFDKLERGKFLKVAAKGSSVIVLSPKLAKAFPTSRAVNEALSGLLALTEKTAKLTEQTRRTSRKVAAA